MVRLDRIYNLFTGLPGTRRDYGLLDFARDLYSLETSEVKAVRAGASVSFPASTGTKNPRGTISFIGQNGENRPLLWDSVQWSTPMTDTLPIVEWLSVIKGEYLDGFVKHGGSAIKFAVPASEELGTLLGDALSATALDLGYQVVTVDSGETRVHMPQDILFRIAEQIDWRLLARKVVLRIAKDAGFRTDNIDPRTEPSIVSAISAVSSNKESIIRLELRTELRKTLPRPCI